jgi:hypothetical protein
MRGAEFSGGALLVSQRRACAQQAIATCRRGGPSCGGPRAVGQVLRALRHGRAGLSVRWRPAHRSAQGSKATRARARCAVCGVPQRTNTCRCTHVAVCPGPASTQRLRRIRSLATAGIGHAAHASGCGGSARRVRTATGRCGVANAVLFAQAWPAVTANPSIERTPYGTLRVPPVAAHVER